MLSKQNYSTFFSSSKIKVRDNGIKYYKVSQPSKVNKKLQL